MGYKSLYELISIKISFFNKNAKTLKVFNFSNDIKSLFYYDSKLFILEGTNKLNIIDSTV